MIRNRSRITLLAVLVVAAGGYLAYDQVLRGDAVAPLTLPSASPATVEPSASGDPATGAAPATGDIGGTWTVADGSVAGYRVRERLANLPAESDAVGRTSAVTGSLTVTETDNAVRVTEGDLSVDTTTLASDEGRRDDRLRTEGLETDRFPSATFTLTAPLDVPTAAIEGTETAVTLAGDLTLHGVTRPVEIPATARLADGRVEVLGSLTFALADYEIVAPNVGGFIISIADEGTLEFAVVFGRS